MNDDIEDIDDDVLERLMHAAFHREDPCVEGAALLDALVHAPSVQVEAQAAEHVRTCPRCSAAPGIADGLLAGELELARHRKSLDAIGARIDRAVADLDMPLPDNVVQLGVAAPATHAAPRRRASVMRWAPLMAAAAALVAVGVSVRPTAPQVPALSDVGVHTRSGAIALVSPLDDVTAAPEALVWEAVDGDVSYAVRLERADGALVWTTTVTGAASVDLPAEVRAGLAPATRYQWTVEALLAGERVAASPPSSFRLAPR